MKKDRFILISFILFTVTLQNISCASYRVVKLAKGADSEGNLRDFYAVTENNVIIPEYVINERSEYPTNPETAWEVFQLRKEGLRSKMHERYKIPSSVCYFIKGGFLAVGYTALFPITFPAYYFIGNKNGKSVSDYYSVMIHDQPREPELRNELENY